MGGRRPATGPAPRGPAPAAGRRRSTLPRRRRASAGSNAATRLARPTPSQVPMVAKACRASSSPARASAVTCGPSRCEPRPTRTTRSSARPLQYCSQQPRSPHSQARPSGTTCMWPNSPAMPSAPRTTRPSSTTPPPMPVPMLTSRNGRRVTAGAEGQLGLGRAVRVVVEYDVRAPTRRRAARAPAPRATAGAARTGRVSPAARSSAAAETPTAVSGRPSRDRLDGPGQRVLELRDRVAAGPASESRAVPHHRRRSRRSRRRAPWCRRRRRRRTSGP